MNKLTISIGSNSKDKEQQMSDCISWLKENLQATIVSEIYSSPALNGKDPEYLNAVATALSEEHHENLVKKFKAYETSCGRTLNSKKRGEIPIDIDIVIWNDDILRQKDYCQEYFKIGWKLINKQI